MKGFSLFDFLTQIYPGKDAFNEKEMKNLGQICSLIDRLLPPEDSTGIVAGIKENTKEMSLDIITGGMSVKPSNVFMELLERVNTLKIDAYEEELDEEVKKMVTEDPPLIKVQFEFSI